MSADKEEIALYYEAKNDKVRKRLGIKGGFYWRTAKKLSVAISRGIVAMDDAGFDEEDFKKPVRVHLPVVNDLPPEGVFDTEFCNRYEKGGEDGITMVLIAPSPSVQDKPASTDNTNVNGEDMAEIEENMLLPVSGQILPVRWLAQHGSEKPITHVSRDELRALHNAQDEKLPAVTALAISNKAAQLEPLEIRDLHKLVRDTDKVFPAPRKFGPGTDNLFYRSIPGRRLHRSRSADKRVDERKSCFAYHPYGFRCKCRWREQNRSQSEFSTHLRYAGCGDCSSHNSDGF
nr:RecE family exodeoxyribonuclease [Escherichia coli]